MFSKVNESINSPTLKNNNSVDGINKAGTACTVAACKAPSQKGDCIIM